MSKSTLQEMVVDNISETEDLPVVKPIIGSLEWTDYILSLMSPSELFNGSPTANGLRRICELEFGEIVSSTTYVNATQSPGFYYAAVTHTLRIIDMYTNVSKEFSASVDSHMSDIPAPFNKHLIATLDSKAEAKALRRALKLSVNTAEEGGQLPSEDPIDIVEPASQDYEQTEVTFAQQAVLNALCMRLNINAIDAIATYCVSSEDGLKKVTSSDMALLINKISDFQRKIESIPPSLIGYDKSWRSRFNDSQLGENK